MLQPGLHNLRSGGELRGVQRAADADDVRRIECQHQQILRSESRTADDSRPKTRDREDAVEMIDHLVEVERLLLQQSAAHHPTIHVANDVAEHPLTGGLDSIFSASFTRSARRSHLIREGAIDASESILRNGRHDVVFTSDSLEVLEHGVQAELRCDLVGALLQLRRQMFAHQPLLEDGCVLLVQHDA